NKTFYAQFAERTVVIRWVNYDGTVLEGPTTVIYNSKPEYHGTTPTREATAGYTYTFSGWLPEINDSTVVTSDTTFRAQYSSAVNKHKVTWLIDESSETQEYEYGTTPAHTDPKKTDYDFVGWLPEIVPVTKDATYTAQFKKVDQLIVSFYSEGKLIDRKIVNKNSKVEKPDDPTKEGYTFDGWYIDDGTFATKWDFEKSVTADLNDLNLYAKWKSNEYTVTLDKGSGTCSIDKIEVYYGMPYGSLPEAKKDDRFFEGWWTKSADGEFENRINPYTKVNINSDHTLYARYLYNVSYYTEDGLYSGNYIYDDLKEPRAIKPDTTPTKDGYLFGYWADASGNEYDFNSILTGNIALRASFYNYRYVGPVNRWVLENTGYLLFTFKRFEYILRETESKRDLKKMFEENGKKIYVDNKPLSASDYENGSLKIFLHDKYLNTLSVGTHTLKVEFKDGTVSADFIVKERPKPSTPTYVAPKTGN
ncbi:MAG: InlB B-repeat-containing protein, partial [Erysipelotrichaceae bacterium]|nr:InlB B-repeat-containing protein [Erysipelotrichaceae bacterium]